MRIPLLSLLLPLALADVEITSPAAGSTIAAGTITVKWKDSGDKPALTDLESYTLSLVVGGNEANTQLPLTTCVAGAKFSGSNSATCQITPGLASSVKNGFFLAMTSVAKSGGNVINYSDRFTVSGMTGQTPANIASAVPGTTKGPAKVNNVGNAPVAGGGAAAGAAGQAPAAGAAAFTVPYNLQTGLIRYAPMQPVPPTKITAKKVTPLFPTSRYTIAKSALPLPSITLTITESQTFSVKSHENTAAPASKPNAAMAKYLARWRD
ncbi:hypothetical protein K470DRAFT_254149 [Piedraia hortae CBS 480.64]|uniref:Uncharacterized protein n=1 Tax=Piedraia hortae CBS 480.64 TaxID=1314780 RepID=A0A6A7CAF4_9PEZI|nr:hypothetical protein K470DRAFT_254149 [Piedraia hortae CBS 480.64]